MTHPRISILSAPLAQRATEADCHYWMDILNTMKDKQ